MKYRAKRRLHRLHLELDRDLELEEVEACLLAALEDALPVLPSFFRKAGVVASASPTLGSASSASAPALSAAERRPRQPAFSTRLPFGDVPDGAPIQTISGWSKQERAAELPARPLPGDDSSALDQRLLHFTALAVPFALLKPATNSDGFALSLALCAALRDAKDAAPTNRSQLLPAAQALASKLPPAARRQKGPSAVRQLLAAAASVWKLDVRVYELEGANKLRHIRFAQLLHGCARRLARLSVSLWFGFTLAVLTPPRLPLPPLHQRRVRRGKGRARASQPRAELRMPRLSTIRTTSSTTAGTVDSSRSDLRLYQPITSPGQHVRDFVVSCQPHRRRTRQGSRGRVQPARASQRRARRISYALPPSF